MTRIPRPSYAGDGKIGILGTFDNFPALYKNRELRKS